MTIKSKLFITTIAFITVLLTLSFTILYGYQYVTGKVSLANDFDKESMYLQMMLRGLNEVLITQGSSESVQIAKEGYNRFNGIHNRLLIQIDDAEIYRDMSEGVDPYWQLVKNTIGPYFEHDLDLKDDESLIRLGELITITERIIEKVNIRAEEARAVVDENSKKFPVIEKTLVALTIILLISAFFFSYHMYHYITRPIGELTGIAEGFSKGDLSVTMDESRSDEFGTLARFFNKSIKILNQTTQQLQERKKELTDLNTKLCGEIAERKQAEEAISHMEYHDTLTGLPNRYLFHDRLTMFMTQTERHQKKGAVLLIDIDNLKRINDTLGHSEGDILLKEVADVLHVCIRATDTMSHEKNFYDTATSTLARLGGDVFTIMLTDIQEPHAGVKVAQRLMKSVSRPFNLNGTEVFITLSIGIAVCPDDGKNADQVLKNADAALNHAKTHGRNSIKFYKESMNSIALKRLTVENELRKAIERNEMMLYYQPRIDVLTGAIVSTEALCRWQKPDAGIVSPAEFIPVAEDSGLILPLGEWILNTACEQNMAWQKSGLIPVSVSVNISGKQFKQNDFVKTISDAIKNSDLAPQYLELEITENILMSNEHRIIDMMKELKDMGIRISIDDFGTGYSSFNYLKRFPMDIIKIDKSFIDEIPDNTDDAAIVNAIITMARVLNLTVVAEGVEEKHQLDFLTGIKCDEIQGFYFSKPLPAAELAVLLKKSVLHPSST
jgi:diguanylate cyclase (GGDEF)-like protein